MPQKLTNQDGKVILLSEEAFASSGGEGAIYEVTKGVDSDLVAKIYHTKKIADSKKAKIEFMLANDPTIKASAEIKKAIIWPEEILYRNGLFVGFAMKKVNHAIPLKSLTLARNPSKKYGTKWQKFDHDQIGSHQKRLVIAYNLSQAIQAIHERGNYVLVDMKPENIFVREDASIAMIDLDSIQICDQNTQLPAEVFTEEYAPPEKHLELVDPANGNIPQQWDYFSLAVILYELLFGIHPYQASHEQYTTRPELIKNNLYVHGRLAEDLHRIPKIHENFEKIPLELQTLFNTTFGANYFQTDKRITPTHWAKTIIGLFNLPATANLSLDLIPLPSQKTTVNFVIAPKKDLIDPRTGPRILSGKQKPKPLFTFSGFAGFCFIPMGLLWIWPINFLLQFSENSLIHLIGSVFISFVLLAILFYKIDLKQLLPNGKWINILLPVMYVLGMSSVVLLFFGGIYIFLGGLGGFFHQSSSLYQFLGIFALSTIPLLFGKLQQLYPSIKTQQSTRQAGTLKGHQVALIKGMIVCLWVGSALGSLVYLAFLFGLFEIMGESAIGALKGVMVLMSCLFVVFYKAKFISINKIEQIISRVVFIGLFSILPLGLAMGIVEVITNVIERYTDLFSFNFENNMMVSVFLAFVMARVLYDRLYQDLKNLF